MNQDSTTTAHLEALQARFALRLAASLTEQSEQCAPDISERLRHARERALLRARETRATAPRTAQAINGTGGFTLSLQGSGDGDGSPWWNKLAALLPLLALVGGLMLIQHWHSQNQINAAADIDLSLLADDLPPDAYSDPGFLEFLQTPRD